MIGNLLLLPGNTTRLAYDRISSKTRKVGTFQNSNLSNDVGRSQLIEQYEKFDKHHRDCSSIRCFSNINLPNGDVATPKEAIEWIKRQENNLKK